MQSTRGRTPQQGQGTQLKAVEYFFRGHLQPELVWMKTSQRFLQTIRCVSRMYCLFPSPSLCCPRIDQGGTGGTAPINSIWDVVIARKRDDHAVFGQDFARRGHLAISNEFICAPGSFHCSSCAGKDSKTPRCGFDLYPDWPRSSPFRLANPVRQRSGSVQAITLFACQVGFRFCADREILHGPFESAGRLQFWSMSSSAVQTRTRTLFLTEPSNP